jgi:hypothetical protein
MTGSVYDRLDAEWRSLARRPVPEAWLAEGGALRGALEAGAADGASVVAAGRIVGVTATAGDTRTHPAGAAGGASADARGRALTPGAGPPAGERWSPGPLGREEATAAAKARHPAAGRGRGHPPAGAGAGRAGGREPGCVRLGAVVEACRCRVDPVAGNRVLGAVLVLARAGDPLAGRAALQALVPMVAATAAGLAGYIGGWGPWASRAELDGEAAAVVAELVRSPLPAGTVWPAAVLRSRLRDRLRTTVARHRRQRRREPALADHDRHPATGLDEAHSAEERMARIVVDATRGGHISIVAAQTVLATTVYGWDTASIARLTGRDVRAVRTHRRRTEQRLSALLVA